MKRIKLMVLGFIMACSMMANAQEKPVQEQVIYFETNQSDLTTAEKEKLQQTIKQLSKDGNYQFKIYGHCDNIGSQSANQALSERRAASIKKYLTAAGYNKTSITYEGLSFNKPADDNTTEDGRKMNRRAELKIYLLPVAPKKMPNQNTVITGNVKSAKLGKLIMTNITFKGQLATKTVTTNTEGKYEVTLPSNDTYIATVDFPNHFGFRQSVSTFSPKINFDIELSPVEEFATLKVSELNFISNKASVTPKSIQALDHLVGQMKKEGKVCFEIGGHVNAPFDMNPNDAYTMDLSLARAVSVYDYLANHGIAKSRMTPRGYGFSQMLKPNAVTVDDALSNMRVEIKVLNCEQIKKFILAEDLNNINRVRISTLYK